MSQNEIDDLRRYCELTMVIRKVAGLVNAIGDRLPWYIQKTRELTISTAPRTGVNGDQIELIAKKLSECLPIIEAMVERSKEIDKKMQAAKTN